MPVATNLTSTASLTHLQTTYWDKVALRSLRKNMQFIVGASDRVLPQRSGKTIQFYRYSMLGSNTTPATEGDTSSPAGQSLTTTTVNATVAQYTDFATLSDMLVDTAIDDIVEGAADQIAYRAARTVDEVTRNVVDAVAASIDVTPVSTNASPADWAKITAIFKANDIPPMSDGWYKSIVHPYTLYDFLFDPTVGGFNDFAKRMASMQGQFFDKEREKLLPCATWAGTEIYESTNVTVITGSPNKYRSYFFANDGLLAIDLAGRGATRVRDTEKTRFKVNVIRNLDVDVANPTGVIRALVSYNFVYVAKLGDTSPYHVRKIDHPNSLGL